MEFELKATVHIMGAVWYTDQNKYKRIDVTLILSAVCILYYEKYSYQVANTCSRFWGAFHQGESFSIAHALLSFRVAQRN